MRMSPKQLHEAILGLPQSLNPYAPATRQDTDMSNPTPPAKTADLPQTEPSSATPQPIATPDESESSQSLTPKLGGGNAPGMDMAGPQGKPQWEKLELPSKKDIGFQRSDGFFLRIRAVESVPGKFMAQLWKDDEVLDNGFVIVPDGDDPKVFIQAMADEMLDENSERDEQTAPEASEAGAGAEGADGADAGGSGGGAGGGLGGLGGAGGGGGSAGGLDDGPVTDDLSDTGEVEDGDLGGAGGGDLGSPNEGDLPAQGDEGPPLGGDDVGEDDIPRSDVPEDEPIEFGDEDFEFEDEINEKDIPLK